MGLFNWITDAFRGYKQVRGRIMFTGAYHGNVKITILYTKPAFAKVFGLSSSDVSGWDDSRWNSEMSKLKNQYATSHIPHTSPEPNKDLLENKKLQEAKYNKRVSEKKDYQKKREKYLVEKQAAKQLRRQSYLKARKERNKK